MSDDLDRRTINTYREIERATARAGVPTVQHKLRPKTEPIRYRDVQKGDVIMESTAHPVRVVSRSGRNVVQLQARYVWQSESEAPWPLGPFRGDAPAAKAVTRRGTR